MLPKNSKCEYTFSRAVISGLRALAALRNVTARTNEWIRHCHSLIFIYVAVATKFLEQQHVYFRFRTGRIFNLGPSFRILTCREKIFILRVKAYENNFWHLCSQRAS